MKINNLLVILAYTIVSGHVSAQLALPYRQTEILQTSLLESPQAKPKFYCIRCDDIGCEKIPCPDKK